MKMLPKYVWIAKFWNTKMDMKHFIPIDQLYTRF
jgi:hypothetical protein